MMLLRPKRANGSHSDGFTLIEMVISILILGVILAPLTTSYVLGLGTATSTAQAVSNSTDAEAVATYLTADVASSNTVSPADLTAGQTCSGGGTAILQFKIKDLSVGGAPPTTYVSYVLVADDNTAGTLHQAAGSVDTLDRVTCDAFGAEIGQLTLARTLQASPQAAPACDDSTCSNNSKPQKVSLSLTAYEYEKLTPPTPTSPFTFTVTASRRVNS